MSAPRDDRNDGRPVFVAETEDVREFARLLRGVGLKHNAIMEVQESMMIVTVEDSRTLCALSYIPTSIFSTWTFHQPTDDPPMFEFSLDSMLQCLNIFGNAGSSGKDFNIKAKKRWAGEGDGLNLGGEEREDDRRFTRDKRGMTGMRMEWMGPGYELTLLLQDEHKGPTTTCSLRTLEPEEILNPPFHLEDLNLNMIMQSDSFRNALLDLPPSSNRITITAKPPYNGEDSEDDRAADADESDANVRRRRKVRQEQGQFIIKAEGDLGTVELEHPNDRDIMQSFACVEGGMTFSYHSVHFAHLAKALQGSIKICLQIDDEGVLNAQIMVAEGDDIGGHRGLLEYKLQALEDEAEQ
ncbi:hypothetical protein L198_06723 [Cryptococcus wingfieldii CBS 7118]|uniref:Cell cycle checkpoint protein n=1 Tax=Cryptococcus wingfieldii CBS 7118 TaxID=1295528 RepID=A0A1E3IL67_9TREE|nr:hypothetical protein L198_06723 [Cryptococcus wingfieldii CBS 7118]ODN88451.1 hypothetical protein L198_06723 [Cryptococcus wingfieldii CBS 7118]